MYLNNTVKTLRPRQKWPPFGRQHFEMHENVWISIKISLKFITKDQINNIPPLVQIMAWRRPGDKPLSEPIMFNLLTHICVTRPQWVNNKDSIKAKVRIFPLCGEPPVIGISNAENVYMSWRHRDIGITASVPITFHRTWQYSTPPAGKYSQPDGLSISVLCEWRPCPVTISNHNARVYIWCR